ncbi:MAG: LPS export ABC transporter periplasmic protein LptC [Syntrophothermus sp.]
MKLTIFIFSLLIFTGCEEEKVKPPISSLNVKEIPAQESWNSKVIFSDSGITKAILNTGHLRVFSESRETLLDQNIKVDFYNNEEVKTTTLTAKNGKVDDASQNLWAYDSVVVVNDSGVVIKTDELMWRNLDKKIVSDKYVKITSPVETIEGIGFESDQSLRNYVIYKITYITRRDSIL